MIDDKDVKTINTWANQLFAWKQGIENKIVQPIPHPVMYCCSANSPCPFDSLLTFLETINWCNYSIEKKNQSTCDGWIT